MTAATLNQFQRWIADAAQEVGAELRGDIDPLGLEFEAEGRVARIIPHGDEALAVIEVEVQSLEDLRESDVARLAVQLLKLNHEARFEHGWSIVIDDDDMLSVTTTLRLDAVRGNRLAEILYEGI